MGNALFTMWNELYENVFHPDISLMEGNEVLFDTLEVNLIVCNTLLSQIKESTRMTKQTTQSNAGRIIDMEIWRYPAGNIEADLPPGIWAVQNVALQYDFLIELTNLIKDALHPER